MCSTSAILARCLALALFAASIWPGASPGAVDVNPPIPLTHRVLIQPIRVKKVDGTTAVTFGTAAQELYIKQQINRIWAQVGVRIDWLPLVDYTNDFAYQGTTLPRPQGDLATIVNSAGMPPKSPSPIVVNMFFVEIVPGFNQTNDNTVNGLAFVDGNGTTIHVGANLPGFEAGRDIVAGVIAHELGHNLGLGHEPDGGPNLMSPGGSTEQLTATQQTTIFTDNPPFIDGFDLLHRFPSNFQLWAQARGLVGGAVQDDDRDGLPNVVEFMLGLDPEVFSMLPAPTSDASGTTWTLTKNAQALADGLIYQVQTGPDLQNWFAAGTAGSGSTVLVNNATTLTVRLNRAAGPRGFMRLNVAIPASLEPQPSLRPSATWTRQVLPAPGADGQPGSSKTAYPAGADVDGSSAAEP